MKKLILIVAIIIGALFGGFKYGEAKQDASITERVITEVVTPSIEGGKYTRVVNIQSKDDVIIIENQKNVRVGDRIQVDWHHDEIVHVKNLHQNFKKYANK